MINLHRVSEYSEKHQGSGQIWKTKCDACEFVKGHRQTNKVKTNKENTMKEQ